MRAIVVKQFGGPEALEVGELPDPQPSADEVLVRVRAAGVNPVDSYIRTGTYAIKPNLPYTPGADAAGDVVAVGANVSDLKPGERVYVAAARPGSYAELIAAPRDRVWRLPERLSYAQGAAVGVPYATAWRAVHDKAQARPGEWMLVHGASGAVGSAAVQMGVALGLRVIGTASSEAGQALVRRLGADAVLDHRDDGHMARALELTGGRGLDVIVELLANVNLAKDLPSLARNGRVIVVGNRGTVEINPRDLMGRDARVEGFVLFNASSEELRRIHAGLGAGFASGTLSPVIGREFPLEQAAEAHRAVMESGMPGKVVLVA
jgi:NADPH2:quinone reductase